jgi:hypothetical protein
MDMPSVSAELKSFLTGVTVLVIDDVGPLSAIIRTTQATQVHLTSAQMLVGHRCTLTGDIREGQFGLIAINIPPRRFISPKVYKHAIGLICGVIRTAVGSGIPMTAFGSSRRMQSRDGDLLQLITDKVVYRTHYDHCMLDLELPEEITGPLDGCTVMLTKQSHRQPRCNHEGTVHYNIFQQHRADTRAKLELRIDTMVLTKLLGFALKLERPLGSPNALLGCADASLVSPTLEVRDPKGRSLLAEPTQDCEPT